MTFTADVDRWVQKTKRNLSTIVTEGIEEIARETFEKTPKVTGRLAGSWVVSLNTPLRGQTGRFAQRVSSLQITGYSAGDTIYFGNTEPQARRIEYGFVGSDSLGRSYNQRGRFMLTTTLANANNIFERVARRVRG